MSRTIILLAFLAATRAAFAWTYLYVSPDGDDDNYDGKAETFDGTHGPYKTLNKALKTANGAWYEVRVMKGEYKLDTTPMIRSANVSVVGWKATRDEIVLDGQGQCRCLTFLTNETLMVKQNYTGVTVKGMTFRNGYVAIKSNFANWSGVGAGALLSSDSGWGTDGDVKVIDCVFEGCTNRYNNGGGLYVSSGAFVTNCVFRNNVCCSRSAINEEAAQGGGAGAYAPASSSSKTDTTFVDCTFENNIATNGVAALGAGCYHNQAGLLSSPRGLIVRKCTFIGNRSVNNTANKTTSGSCLGQKSWQVEDCTFVSNKAETVNGSAGGVFTCVATPTNKRTNTFVRCHFLYNKTATSGAAIRAGVNCPLRLEGCTFVGNGITGDTGQTAVTASGDVTMIGCTATGNNDRQSGAWLGAFLLGARAYVSDCTFTNHTHYGNYGTLRVAGDSLVENTRVCGSVVNSSAGSQEWGALAVIGANTIVRNCLIAKNGDKWKRGGGLTLESGATNARIENCTIVDNYSGEATLGSNWGPAVYAASSQAAPEIVNCLFANNKNCHNLASVTQFGPNIDKSKVDYCWADTDELTVSDGMHNLPVGDGKPYFDAKSEYAYMPSRRTPGRDKAQVLGWMIQGRDLYGAARISGPGPDFGCVERPFVFKGLLFMVR